jgi:tetratricopeptide (TPR) repeat protein
LAQDGSIAGLTTRIKDHPGNAHYYNMRGLLYLNDKSFDLAIADFDKAMKFSPVLSATLIANRAAAYSGKGQYPRAIDELGRSLKMDPQNAWIHYQRAMVFKAKGDPRRSIADLDGAIRLSPRYVDAYRERAAAYLQIGDRGRARADLSQAVTLSPKLRSDEAFVAAEQAAADRPQASAPSPETPPGRAP